MSLRTDLSRAIAEARDRAIRSGALSIGADATLPAVGLERPANPDHGDWASNAAMQLAPVARAAPMRIAEALLQHFEPPASIATASVAAPGFLNFRLDPQWIAGQVGPIRDAGAAFGSQVVDQRKRINVEFVSANPTGPLHVGNARGAFVGDVLSRVLTAAGHQVTREYYFNDFGGQVKALGASVRALRVDEPIPEDGYRGDYVKAMAASVPQDVVQAAEAADADEADWIYGRWASEVQRRGIEASLASLGVAFDVWKTESSIHD
ncbi:MAG TPA: arginine--tRNA ligase, partial [Candidatus Limnocylindria bacterium]|nr:arginine--tRNA ligase [Candidatus Limnocylindria bacterium]